MKIVVTHALPSEVEAAVYPLGDIVAWSAEGAMPDEDLAAAMRDADGLLCTLVDRIDQDLLDLAPDLRVVSTFSVGLDHVDVDACTRRRIPVGHTPNVLTETTADTAFALLLTTARRLGEGIDFVRDGEWGSWDPDLLLGRDVHSSTLGIVGMGRIGAAVAARGAGFGMSIVYANRSAKPDVEERLSARRLELDALLEQSDHVVVTVALAEGTRHIIDDAALRRMKPTATLVNIGRGPLVDTDALVDALEAGEIFAAGLDVTDPEPLPADHPLVSMPNCIVIPHLGSSSVQTRLAMAQLAADNLIAGLRGDRLPACANPEVYTATS